MFRFFSLFAWFSAAAYCADPPAADPFWGRFKPSVEFRAWLEHRDAPSFGKNPDFTTVLIRTRFNLEYRASSWLNLGGTVQDARAPGYYDPKPGSAKNPTELHEAYAEFGRKGENGWGGLIGRRHFFLGSQNIIGVPEWGNSGRTYDAARVYWRNPAMHLEALYVSIVKFNANGFDKPVLGDHLIGTYNTFSKAVPKAKMDLFLLGHSQNIPAGFAGPGRLQTFSYGGRLAGAAGKPWLYDLELIGQTGEIAYKPHSAFGTNLMATRKSAFVAPLDLVFEYKYASGTSDPKASRSNTFDQLYPANHDRFGHADMFGFRNISTVRWVNRVRWGKHTTINVAYANNWVAQAKDGLYDLLGKLYASPPASNTSTHVGQELAIYSMTRVGRFQFGAGYAYWWIGDYARAATPGASPQYLYLHQSFVFP